MASFSGRPEESTRRRAHYVSETDGTLVSWERVLTWRVQDPVEPQYVLRALLRPYVAVVKRHEAVDGLVQEVASDFRVAEREEPVVVVCVRLDQEARVDDQGRVED